MGFAMETGDNRRPELYNVVYVVGQNAASFFNDVKLLQYCLRAIYATGHYSAPERHNDRRRRLWANHTPVDQSLPNLDGQPRLVYET